jgi:hypothetical protein
MSDKAGNSSRIRDSRSLESRGRGAVLYLLAACLRTRVRQATVGLQPSSAHIGSYLGRIRSGIAISLAKTRDHSGDDANHGWIRRRNQFEEVSSYRDSTDAVTLHRLRAASDRIWSGL